MHPTDLERYNGLLLLKQQELSVARLDTETRVPGASTRGGDLIDEANADAEADLQIRLHQSAGRLSRAIEEALVRMIVGTYGVCFGCKQPISQARLEAVPWTGLCRDCKERDNQVV
jgi:DnaK suppressor protein